MYPINKGGNRYEFSPATTVRPVATEKNPIAYEDFLGSFGYSGKDSTFVIKLDDYDREEISRKLVTKIKEGDEIHRLYSDDFGYVGFGLFNFEEGKIRYFDDDLYMKTGEYKFLPSWNKPDWMRIK